MDNSYHKSDLPEGTVYIGHFLWEEGNKETRGVCTYYFDADKRELAFRGVGSLDTSRKGMKWDPELFEKLELKKVR